MTIQKINIQVSLLAIVLCVSLPIAVFGGLALAFICAFAAIVALFSVNTLNIKKLFVSDVRIAVFSFLALIIWSAITIQWTLNEEKAFSAWIKLALLGAAAPILLVFSSEKFDSQKRMWFGKWLVRAFIVALVLALSESITDGAIIRAINKYILGFPDYIPKMSVMNRGACYLSLVFWAVAARLYDNKRKIFLAIFIFAFIVLTRLASLSAVMGFIAGALTFFYVQKYGQKKFDLPLIAIVIFIVIAFPLVNFYTNPAAIGEMQIHNHHIMPLSSLHRVFIWHFSMGKIIEKPLLGWGFDSSPFIPGGNDLIIGRYLDFWRYLPLHTHNNIIQLWLELGVLGPLLFLGMLAGTLIAIRKNENISNTAKASLAAVVMAYFTIGLTGFGFWQFWWIGAGFLSGAAVLAIIHDNNSLLRGA